MDENDREYCGTGIPKVEANLNLTAGYKGFDLSLLFGSAWGHKLFNGNRYFYESMQTPGQMLTSVLDAWTPTNTDTDMPRAVLNDPNRNARESDRFLENGNFVRLRQAQLGYTLPTNILKKAYIENYVSISAVKICLLSRSILEPILNSQEAVLWIQVLTVTFSHLPVHLQ